VCRPELYLEYATFEEEHNNAEKAEALYNTLLKTCTHPLFLPLLRF
jgi:hypothetical protein